MTHPAADLYQGQKHVATITRTGAGYRFDLVDDLDRGVLSSTLPAEKFPFEAAELHPFFLNLLPEGARLQLLLDTAKASDDTLDLLLRVGWDAIGDVAVVPHGDSIERESAQRVDDPSTVSFRELLADVAVRDASIAGVQDKLSDATIAFAIGNRRAGPSLLKLDPPRFPRLVHNEQFFLRVAAACGIDVNRAALIEDRDGDAGLLVTRFDRIRKCKSTIKLHQEDACQLLDIVPARKYRVSMREVSEAIQAVASAPVVECRRLLELYIFSYLIGNGDLHAKNISLLWHEVVTLSPGYDLLSTLPYPSLSRNMALPLEGKDANFKAADFIAFGERCGVPATATRKIIERLSRGIGPWLDRLGEIGYDEATTAALRAEIVNRIERLSG